MGRLPNSTPRWSSLGEFCSDCHYAARCPRTTLAEVQTCPLVKDQLRRNIAIGLDLGPPIPLDHVDTVVRRVPSFEPSREKRRGRRPLNERGVERLLRAVLVPVGPEG